MLPPCLEVATQRSGKYVLVLKNGDMFAFGKVKLHSLSEDFITINEVTHFKSTKMIEAGKTDTPCDIRVSEISYAFDRTISSAFDITDEPKV